MILKRDLGFQTVMLYYQLSSDSKKYDVKEGFRIPDCNIVLSIK
jgi:hypothetical protein